jgi:hypothetical protein
LLTVLFITALSCCTTDDAVLKIITVRAFVVIASVLVLVHQFLILVQKFDPDWPPPD